MLVFLCVERGDILALFNLIFKRETPEQATDPPEEEQNSYSPDDLLLTSLLRGEKMTREKAMSIPAVAGAVDRISNLVAMLPIKMYKYVQDGDRKKVEEVTEDVRLKILNEDTGDLLDSFQLKKAIVNDYLTDKGAYIFIEKERNNFKSLRYVKPECVSPLTNYDPIFKDAKYLVNGNEYEMYNFITVLRQTKDGVKGISAIDEINKSIETAFNTILFESSVVKKGGAKKGFLTSERKLGNEEMNTLKSAWHRYYGNNEENMIVLNQGIKFQDTSNSSAELQIDERKKTLASDIREVFHIYSDYNNTIKDGVIPIISAIETALNKNFLLEDEKGKMYFAFDTKKITRGSLKERYEAYKIASDTGWMTKNEIRRSEDYDEIDGLDVISMNLANVLYDIKTGKYYTPNTGSVMNLEKGGGEPNENTSQE